MVSSIRLTMKIHTFSTTNSIQMIDPRRLQDYTMSERSIVSQSSRVYIVFSISKAKTFHPSRKEDESGIFKTHGYGIQHGYGGQRP